MTKCVALSIVSPHGVNIAAGRKTIEVRSWLPPTLPIRDLLIVENANFLTDGFQVDPNGRAVALVDVRPLASTAQVWAKRKLYAVELPHARFEP